MHGFIQRTAVTVRPPECDESKQGLSHSEKYNVKSSALSFLERGSTHIW